MNKNIRKLSIDDHRAPALVSFMESKDFLSSMYQFKCIFYFNLYLQSLHPA